MLINFIPSFEDGNDWSACYKNVSFHKIYYLFLHVVFCLQQVSQMDADLKTKSHSYNSLKGNLQTLERKAT